MVNSCLPAAPIYLGTGVGMRVLWGLRLGGELEICFVDWCKYKRGLTVVVKSPAVMEGDDEGAPLQ